MQAIQRQLNKEVQGGLGGWPRYSGGGWKVIVAGWGSHSHRSRLQETPVLVSSESSLGVGQRDESNFLGDSRFLSLGQPPEHWFFRCPLGLPKARKSDKGIGDRARGKGPPSLFVRPTVLPFPTHWNSRSPFAGHLWSEND